MEQQVLSATELRVIIAVIGVVVLALIYVFGRPRKAGQGERRPAKRVDDSRIEPTFGEDGIAQPEQGELDVSLRAELDRLGRDMAARPGAPQKSPVGVRPDRKIERIVTLFIASRAGEMLAGSDVVVAAEKAGMQFGDMGIFHRLVSGKTSEGPVFSMANMVKPGNFDMSKLDALETPGVTLFMTLPGPLPALDAWEMMLPTAQRLAELLDAAVLDEERNALGRQRIAHLRDELRAWDRQQERNQIRPGR
jgi:cell division protein ZipA